MSAYFLLAAAVTTLTWLGQIVRTHFAKEKSHSVGSSAAPRPWTLFDLTALALLIGFAGARYEVGTDYGNYVSRFERIQTSNWESAVTQSASEAGFTILTILVKSMSTNPQTFFWVTSAMTVLPVYLAIRRYSSSPALSVAIYILLAAYLSPLNIVRQGLAVALVFYAVTMLRHRHIRMVLVGLVAVSIHASAGIALAVMWLARRWRPTVRNAMVVLFGALFLALLYDQLIVIDWVIRLATPQYESYLPPDMAGIGTYLLIAAHLALLAYAWIMQKPTNASDESGWMVNYVLIGVAFMVLGTQALMFSRLASYFTIFLILLLPERVAQSNYPLRHTLALLGASIVYFTLYLQNWGDLIPYQTNL